MKEDVGRLKPPPLREIVAISVKQIRNRPIRSLIALSGVFLGIAFLVATVTASLVNEGLKHDEAIRSGLAAVAPVGGIATETQKRLWLVAISLGLATIGIMNSMFMSVTERFREIGTMKCMGALNGSILRIFLFEGGLLGLIGSAAGVLAGFLLAMIGLLSANGLVATLGHLPPQQESCWCLIAFGLGLGLSVIGSLFPAFRAIAALPADAMRTEV